MGGTRRACGSRLARPGRRRGTTGLDQVRGRGQLLAERRKPPHGKLVVTMVALQRHSEQTPQQQSSPTVDLADVCLFGPTRSALHKHAPLNGELVDRFRNRRNPRTKTRNKKSPQEGCEAYPAGSDESIAVPDVHKTRQVGAANRPHTSPKRKRGAETRATLAGASG